MDLLGFSQGGLAPRFALRFWPDVRDMVDDYVALGATNHGSLTVTGMCGRSSAFTLATNSYQETFAGISYTNIYSHTDQFVTPTSTHPAGRRCMAAGEASPTSPSRTSAR